MHLAPIPGSSAAINCTGVALTAPLLNIVSCLEPMVPLSELIQGLVDTQVTSRRPPRNSISTSFTLLGGRTIWSIFYQPSVDSQWPSSITFLTGIPLGPVVFICGAQLAMYFYSGHCPASISSRMRPVSWSFNWCQKCDWIPGLKTAIDTCIVILQK
jgi:hypothetical protein